ncbi:16S rRNA (cytosine(1402)-N(4))-methyltransferase, partial [Verminephrobacter sp. Larva24]
ALARVRPDAAEVAANPRARSAIMRVAERTQAHGAERSDMRRTERPDARRAEHGEVLPP